MAAKKSSKNAKISTTKKVVFKKKCPVCQANGTDSEMAIIKMVRHSKPSGMFWVCPKCASEVSAHV